MAQQKANALKNVLTQVADLEIPTVVHFLLIDLGVKRMFIFILKNIYIIIQPSLKTLLVPSAFHNSRLLMFCSKTMHNIKRQSLRGSL